MTFCHENQACPPSLSNIGKLRQGTKADLLNNLENYNNAEMFVVSTHPDSEIAILGGTVLVNFLKPVSVKAFSDYAVKVFLSYIKGKLLLCKLRRCCLSIHYKQFEISNKK